MSGEAWVFTFGHGQRLRSTSAAGRADSLGTDRMGDGFALHNRYVRIESGHDVARARMYEVFGPVWSMEYLESDHTADMIDRFGLVELDITEPIAAPRDTVTPAVDH